MCSCAPLSLAELVAAVCQDPETDVTNSVDIDISYILSACHNLLVIDQQLGVCRPSHLSVQEYFEDHHWSYSQANTLVAKVCLILLNDPVQQERDPQSANEQGGNGISDIVQYARLHWATHVQRHSEEKVDDRLSTLLKFFLGSMNESGPAYRSWHKTVTEPFANRSYRIPLCSVYDQLIPPTLASFAICAFGFYKIISSWWISGFANVDQRNHNGESLLQLAATLGFISITEELLRENADANTKNNIGRMALSYAANNGHEAVVRQLLEHQAEVNAKDNYGGTALHYAAGYGHEAVVRLLLGHQADVNENDDDRGTALRYAAENGHEAVVRLLLEHQADVNANDDDGWTALHCAAFKGYEAVVRLLLEHHAEINAKNNYGGTALHYAAKNGHEAVVRLLLEHQADVNAKCSFGWTALQFAAENGHEAIGRLLQTSYPPY
jgi:ankyrin repeat protein